MTTPAYEIASYLAGKGLVTLGGTSDWAAFVSHLPDAPDRAVATFDTGGPGANPKFTLEEVNVKFTLRGKPYEYDVVYDKAFELKDAILGLPETVIGSTKIIGVWMAGDISAAGQDERGRVFVSMSFRIIRVPSKTTNSNRLDI